MTAPNTKGSSSYPSRPSRRAAEAVSANPPSASNSSLSTATADSARSYFADRQPPYEKLSSGSPTTHQPTNPTTNTTATPRQHRSAASYFEGNTNR